MKKILLVLTAALMIITLSACNVIKDKVADAVKSAIANQTAETVATEEPADEPEATVENTAAPDETAPEEETAAPADNSGVAGFWPESIPNFVPKFNYGAYSEKDSGTLEANGSAVYTMNFTGIKAEDLDAYREALKSAGFTDATKTEYEGGVLLAANYKKDGVESSVLATLNTKDGTCVLLLTVVTSK